MHPVVKEVNRQGTVSHEVLKQLMRKHGIDPRGIGGLSNAKRIEWVGETRSWKPGLRATKYSHYPD